MPKDNKKGVILAIVIGSIFIIFVLAGIIAGLITSHSRLTRLQISRMQAYYAGMAGINYALARLSLPSSSAQAWTSASCPNATPCEVTDSWPNYVKSVKVIFCDPGATCGNAGYTTPCTPIPGPGLNFCVYSVVDYTYTPPAF